MQLTPETLGDRINLQQENRKGRRESGRNGKREQNKKKGPEIPKAVNM
jgi:hypothetical protein